MRKPSIIACVGLVGSGKSSVAKELVRLTHARLVESDRVRVKHRRQGKSYATVSSLVEEAALHAVKQKKSVILDADFITAQKRKSLLSKAKAIGVRVNFIRITADPDIMIGRIMKARYTRNDLFGGATTSWKGSSNRGAVVKLREMWRRTPHHYRWESKNGGRWMLKPMPFALTGTIDTTDGKSWKRVVKRLAKKFA